MWARWLVPSARYAGLLAEAAALEMESSFSHRSTVLLARRRIVMSRWRAATRFAKPESPYRRYPKREPCDVREALVGATAAEFGFGSIDIRAVACRVYERVCRIL